MQQVYGDFRISPPNSRAVPLCSTWQLLTPSFNHLAEGLGLLTPRVTIRRQENASTCEEPSRHTSVPPPLYLSAEAHKNGAFPLVCASGAGSVSKRERAHVQPSKCSSLQFINFFPFVLCFVCWVFCNAISRIKRGRQ